VSTKTKTLRWIGLTAAAVVLLIGVLAIGMGPSLLDGRLPGLRKDMAVDETMRTQLIDNVVEHVERHYIFPDQARAAIAALRERQRAGDFGRIDSAIELTDALTAVLREVTGDRHLSVDFSEQPIPMPSQTSEAVSSETRFVERRQLNFGFAAVQRLEFNIGYLDLRMFAAPEWGEQRLAAAMTLLADTDAMIIDLRHNYGGDPKTVALLASYFFDERTRLNDIYYRSDDRTEQMWTHETVVGPRYGSQRKLYLLTSNDTFSAAEDFAYALKNLQRATIVGASTGGGAHPAEAFRLGDHFGMIVPVARSISPVTGTDWEGVGVLPDVAVDPDDALARAQQLALREFLASGATEPRAEAMRARIDALD